MGQIVFCSGEKFNIHLGYDSSGKYHQLSVPTEVGFMCGCGFTTSVNMMHEHSFFVCGNCGFANQIDLRREFSVVERD